MEYFDYKAVPAPHRSRKVRGVSDPAELFAATLTDAINEQAREGWEYVRTETLSAETPRGFFRRSIEEPVTLMIFRRQREDREPRIESRLSAPVSAAHPAPQPAPRTEPSFATVRNFEERIQAASRTRREPRISEPESGPDRTMSQGVSSPLRPVSPQLGPVEPG